MCLGQRCRDLIVMVTGAIGCLQEGKEKGKGG
jgi:hypothetical protein